MNSIRRGLAVITLVLAWSAIGHTQPSSKAQADKFKKEAAVLESSIDQAVNTAVPGYGLLQRTKSAYIEGYGAVFTLEVAFEPPRNPFNSSKSPAEVRALVTQRRKDVREKLVELIQQKVTALTSLLPTESVAIVTYLVNSNPGDVPDLPSNIVITVKKQDVLDLQDSKITASELSAKVSIREF